MNLWQLGLKSLFYQLSINVLHEIYTAKSTSWYYFEEEQA